jgi:hypothetical protein
MNNQQLNQTLRRGEQHRFQDGILETAMGGMALLLGLYFYIQAAYPESQVSEFLTATFLVIFVGGWYLMHRIAEKLKERLTYPRSGYTAPREARAGRGLRAAAAVVGAALLAAGLAYFQLKAPPVINFMPVVFALVVGILFTFLGFKTDLARFFALSFISLALGGWFAFSPLENIMALAAYLFSMGVAMLVSGGLNLRRHLAANPLPAEGGDER